MRRRLTPLELLNPNPALAKEARDYQLLYERELAVFKKKGLTDSEANIEAQYRASVELPRLREKRAAKKMMLLMLVILGAAFIWAFQSGRLSNLRIEQFFPKISEVTILFCVFFIARGENQRWVRARSRGLMGASVVFGGFVDLTGFAALVFGMAWPLAYGYDNGWQSAVGLYISGWLVMLVVSIIFSIVIGAIQNARLNQWEKQIKFDEGTLNDSLILWMLGTFALWPLMYALATWVSWFSLWR